MKFKKKVFEENENVFELCKEGSVKVDENGVTIKNQDFGSCKLVNTVDGCGDSSESEDITNN